MLFVSYLVICEGPVPEYQTILDPSTSVLEHFTSILVMSSKAIGLQLYFSFLLMKLYHLVYYLQQVSYEKINEFFIL